LGNDQKKYPTRKECLNILNQLKCPEHVIQHLLTVTDLALRIADRIPEAEVSLVEAGALLHDIGRSRTHGIQHGVVGSRLARELDLPEEIINIIECHLGAGIPEQEAVKLGLPKKNYIPITIEQKIVAHADNLVEGEKRCSIKRSIQILQNRSLPDVAERVKSLHVALSRLAGIDIDEI
jgi:uncharacterized protein (TIGR00295 family)